MSTMLMSKQTLKREPPQK